MFDSNHPILGSQHADVLSAEPETEEAKTSLVEEIKNRARGIFASGNYPIAEILYDKAIKVKPDAILYANRSAARLQLNMADAALEDADRAIGLDKDYSKAYYRKGQAHNARKEFDAALRAFEQGLQLDPTNKTFADMAAKAKAAAAKATSEGASKAAEAAASTPSTSSTSSSSASTGGAAPAPPRKPKAASGGKKKSAAGSDDEDEEATLKAEELRGYKVLADGRKTTYFNNELSEETKKLIGDIAPKKIDPTEAPAGAGNSAAGAGGGQPSGSAWNYAGTFEERNMTAWAKEKLQELLSGVSFVIPNNGAVLDVVKVSGLDGDASVTFVRGKKKYLFDFVFTLEWEAELDCGKAKGTLKYPDVTPDNDDEYDTLLEVDQLTPPEARHLINMYVKSDSAGLQEVVKEKLRQFMKEFQQF